MANTLRLKSLTMAMPHLMCVALSLATWRCLGVAESSSDVADFLLSHYNNFMQFAGQKDGATRYAQVLQFLLADHTFGGILVSLER